VFTVLALHHQVAPPTINLFDQDPECDLDYCANRARPMKIDVAVKNNFGFGGTNGTLVFRGGSGSRWWVPLVAPAGHEPTSMGRQGLAARRAARTGAHRGRPRRMVAAAL
jgi:acyl transferase domain-containing protein